MNSVKIDAKFLVHVDFIEKCEMSLFNRDYMLCLQTKKMILKHFYQLQAFQLVLKVDEVKVQILEATYTGRWANMPMQIPVSNLNPTE